MTEEDNFIKLSDLALLRMRRAHRNGTGCHLTPEMISALSISLIGEWWDNIDLGKNTSLSPEKQND